MLADNIHSIIKIAPWPDYFSCCHTDQTDHNISSISARDAVCIMYCRSQEKIYNYTIKTLGQGVDRIEKEEKLEKIVTEEVKEKDLKVVKEVPEESDTSFLDQDKKNQSNISNIPTLAVNNNGVIDINLTTKTISKTYQEDITKTPSPTKNGQLTLDNQDIKITLNNLQDNNEFKEKAEIIDYNNNIKKINEILDLKEKERKNSKEDRDSKASKGSRDSKDKSKYDKIEKVYENPFHKEECCKILKQITNKTENVDKEEINNDKVEANENEEIIDNYDRRNNAFIKIPSKDSNVTTLKIIPEEKIKINKKDSNKDNIKLKRENSKELFKSNSKEILNDNKEIEKENEKVISKRSSKENINLDSKTNLIDNHNQQSDEKPKEKTVPIIKDLFLLNNFDSFTELNSPLFRCEDIPILEKYGIHGYSIKYACFGICGLNTGDFHDFLKRDKDGVFNFDSKSINPLTNEKIESW